MNAEEFRARTNEKTDRELLEICLQDDITPYVFEPKPPAWNTFREEIALQLGVSQEDIRVVGSGRLGFSMKPGRNLARFTDTSDIDVVIVNPDAFDELWLALLNAVYPRPPMTDKLGGWLKDRRNEVYTGWITPAGIHIDIRVFGNKARGVLDLKTKWFNALKLASRHPPRRHEDVTGRLYRTWQHAELYHLDSLAALRKSLTE
ncbi:MAG: hypothetical protein ACRD2L_05865 [Terriglobia bacterium]